MHEKSIEFINGQLKAWQYVNGKCNHGTTFYIRDMAKPFRIHGMPFDGKCIKNCFRDQLFAITDERPEPGNELEFRDVDWNFVVTSLQRWLFNYLNDENTGNKLSDPTNAFNASDTGFQQAIAKEMAGELEEITNAKQLLLVLNNPEYFDGDVVLLDSEQRFFELRLGDYF